MIAIEKNQHYGLTPSALSGASAIAFAMGANGVGIGINQMPWHDAGLRE